MSNKNIVIIITAFIGVSVVAGSIVVIFGLMGGDYKTKSQIKQTTIVVATTKDTANTTPTTTNTTTTRKTPTPTPEKIIVYTFSSGNYISGEDFKPGTYTITAISGGGNVYSDNWNGINAIMGTGDPDFYEKEYKNITLPKGCTLSIKGVKIKLVKK